MKPIFIAISILSVSIVCISGTPVPASVLMDRDGPSSILAGELVTDNIGCSERARPPPTFLLVPRAPISIDEVREIGKKVEKQVETVVDSEGKIPTIALDVDTEILYDALKGKGVAKITEENGTKLIELVTKLARQTIDHPQWCIGTGDWAL
ncbi:hypothetical protein H0H93_016741, partial [Arthromyces matolae]